MAYINFSPSQNSCTMSVGGLMSYSVYTEIYISCNGSNSHNLKKSGSGHTTSNSWTLYGLSAGTRYFASCRIKTQAGNEGYADDYFYTQSPPAPPTVGDIPYVSVSDYSRGAIRVSWGLVSNATNYRVEVYNDYYNTLYDYSEVSGNSTIFYGVPEGTYLRVKVYGFMNYNGTRINGGYDYGYLMTADYSVGGVGTVYVNQLSTSGSLNVQWSRATNANSYGFEVYDYYNGDRLVHSHYGVTSLSYTVNGLKEGTYYKVKVYGQGSYNNGTASYGYGWTKSFTPTPLTGLEAWAGDARGGIHMRWYSSTNATGYRWEIYRGRNISSPYYVTGSNTTSTSASYTGLSEYTEYTVKVYATRGSINSEYATATVTTKDLTQPNISITTSDGNGRMYILFNGSDSHSGLRSNSTYYTEISNANGTTYGQGSYSTNNYRTFTLDGYGNQFVHNAYYYMKVTTYDNALNSNSTNVRVQFKLARPVSWGWHTVKVAGQPIALTAQEWNSFCIKINQFRQYRSLDNYSFTNATSGGIITASIINQAVNAISAMSPPNNPPSTVVANSTTITASFFNTLSNSLNSIQ